jgi:NAD(P)-dependent dehydrogenase (short-subunit alcohol dehydrogenase family)
MGQKTLLLTGASRGIGHATVKRFSAEGWRVLTCSRHPFDDRCPWPGGEANHVQIDLADPNKTIQALEVIRGKLAASCTRWSTTPASRPRGRTANG